MTIPGKLETYFEKLNPIVTSTFTFHNSMFLDLVRLL